MFTGIIKAMGTIRAMSKRGGDVRLSIDSDGLPLGRLRNRREHRRQRRMPDRGRAARRWFSRRTSRRDARCDRRSATRDRFRGQSRTRRSASATGWVAISSAATSTASAPSRRDGGCALDPFRYRDTGSLFSRYVAKKGSVTVDGVSLTVNEVSGNRFELNIIPHTAEVTIIDEYAVGTKVNIEVDLLARYIERLLYQGQRRDVHRFPEGHTAMPDNTTTHPRARTNAIQQHRGHHCRHADGKMVIMVDDENRENEGDLIMAAAKVRPEDINYMATHGRGLICLTLSRERCKQLRLPLMVTRPISITPPISRFPSRPPKALRPASRRTTAPRPSRPPSHPTRSPST